MSLPSSPPLLPQSSFSDLPSSPPLLPTTSSSTLGLPWISTTRKRQLSEYDDSTLSSDPLFSDDTSGTEDATGYQRPKRKRMVKGPWWELGRGVRCNETTPKQKHFTRKLDSGVWMGSDEGEASVEAVLCSQDGMSRLNVHDRPRSVRTPRAAPKRHSPQAVAADIVNTCVEEGLQRVDLSQLGLTDLLESTLKPLHELIRQPMFDASLPPSDDELGPLTPDLQLFLSTNDLTALPDELFRLENITVLSLRNNALTELPSTISRLKRLQELNVANNAIRHFPWELLDILHSRNTRVILHPNPLIEPLHEFAECSPSALATQLQSKQGIHLKQCAPPRSCIDDIRDRCASEGTLNMRTELELRLQLGHALCEQHFQTAGGVPRVGKSREELVYLASSAVQYYEIDGRPRKDSILMDDDFKMCSISVEQKLQEVASGAAPSLLELSLRSVRHHFDLAQIPDSLPPRVLIVLQTAKTSASDQVCSSCGRGYIVPRAQWVEYWHSGLSSKVGLTQESVLPFMRRVCSWACAVPTEVGTFRA